MSISPSGESTTAPVIRQLHGVSAATYTFGRDGRPQNTERNALAYLLKLPWTEDLWSYGGTPMLYRQQCIFPNRHELNALLIQAQADIPTLTASKLSRAILTVAAANPLDTPPRYVSNVGAK